jgi:hypothetical protein
VTRAPAEGERSLPQAAPEVDSNGFAHDAASGRFRISLEIPASGWLRLSAGMR